MSIKWLGIAVLPLLAGCGLAYGAGGHVEDGFRQGPYYEDSYGGGIHYDHTYSRRVNYGRLPIPRGFVPAPGQCRAWFPGVSPRHQPPSSSCRAAERRVPRGGWLLVRPYRHSEVVELVASDYLRHGARTRYAYDVRSGRRINGYY